MRTALAAMLGLSLVAAGGVVALIRARILPTGVAGEWEWQFVRFAPSLFDLALAAVGVGLYAGFAALGLAMLGENPGRGREAAMVAALVVASLIAQVAIQSGGPVGHGLAKWSTLWNHGASGYFEFARREMRDPARFWGDYPEWVRHQDALHVGTHPPGLFLASGASLRLMERHPGLAERVAALMPATSDRALRTLLVGPVSRSERAAIILMGFLTLVMCAATTAPLYALARSALPAPAAWSAAALWPVVPSALLFQPTADTAFPFLATLALALAAGGGPARAILAGAVLALGMQFSLVFLPVGLIAGIVQASRAGLSWRRRVVAILATGLGFGGMTGAVWAISGANPLAIWWANAANHARFYVENPRSYAAWVVADPIELAVALGLPAALFAAAGLARREAPAASWATLAVLALLDLSGKNLSEVARLWLPFMSPLLAASGAGLRGLGGGPRALGALVALMGLQALGLQATVQVVYPVQ